MRVTLTIPDEVFEKYKAMGGGAEVMMVEQLVKYQGVSPRQRGLMFTHKQRQDLEGLLNTHIESPEQLMKPIREALSVKVQGVEVTLDAATIGRIKQEATWTPTMTFDELFKMKIRQGVDLATQGYTNLV